jgi:hypothetical protein
MSKEFDGKMIEPEKEKGNPLWKKKKKKDILKTESPTGNPLWKNKENLNEKDGGVRKLNE